MSYSRMEEKEKQLRAEVEKLLAQAEETDAAEDALCANMTETSCVTAISEQGGKENQHGNDERFCSARSRCDGSI
jgi:hypothetical protein